MGKIGVGKHKVAIIGTRLGETKDGQLFIEITFGNPDGDTISTQKYTSDKAWEYTERDLKTCGWDAEANGFQFEQFNSEPSPILGNEVSITVEEEEYNGKTRTRVKSINRPSLTADKAGSLAAQLRERLRNRPGMKVPAGETATAEAKPDTLPF